MGWTQYRFVLRLRILLLSHSNNNNFVLLLHAIFYKLCLCSVLSDRPVPWPVWVCKPDRRVGSGLTVGPYAGGDLPLGWYRTAAKSSRNTFVQPRDKS
ncbi:hypothetical protein ElyMa_005950300 [Elysia marginata]|uniref:Secreted protein n=1 Tax=Elysia marginata TaxID=1093978 RepID=A0AAV4GBA8_9GAST|nr:hypothetical protein ElyMa_005950300 [Elysia marginata]